MQTVIPTDLRRSSMAMDSLVRDFAQARLRGANAHSNTRTPARRCQRHWFPIWLSIRSFPTASLQTWTLHARRRSVQAVFAFESLPAAPVQPRVDHSKYLRCLNCDRQSRRETCTGSQDDLMRCARRLHSGDWTGPNIRVVRHTADRHPAVAEPHRDIARAPMGCPAAPARPRMARANCHIAPA